MNNLLPMYGEWYCCVVLGRIQKTTTQVISALCVQLRNSGKIVLKVPRASMLFSAWGRMLSQSPREVTLCASGLTAAEPRRRSSMGPHSQAEASPRDVWDRKQIPPTDCCACFSSSVPAGSSWWRSLGNAHVAKFEERPSNPVYNFCLVNRTHAAGNAEWL